MKKLLLSFFMGLLLSGCATTPSYQVPDGLWYAEKEDPDHYRYHVYVYFKDESHFIWWRTKETQDVVMKRWAYYTHDHPGVDNPTIYTRQGDQLKGERRIVDRSSEGILQATTTQTFNGRFNGDELVMEFIDASVWASGNDAGRDVVRWSMKRLRSQSAK
ncbi:hypothetical protein [Pseudomonas sp. ANT_J28]|uniref:hypothetical protein n=1 Tax=Pseudomonas sp. ANT_J28 TaxID=2597352 RepID=UPI0011F2A126|nr:hypothetical protein [Pseudomonas sp. ANT_J28]KAA0983279.1 hypothetical protein FQ187_12750 [Pseudomonas sp. ANT_J28]